MKTISINELSTSAIDKALADLASYKREVERKNTRLVQQLMFYCEEQAIKEAPMMLGELKDGIYSVMPSIKEGQVISSAPHSAYVEFGTGVIGAMSPHPTMPWNYDVNDHGFDGWKYYNASRGYRGWTRGMPSRPFMLNAAQATAAEVGRIAKEVFAS